MGDVVLTDLPYELGGIGGLVFSAPERPDLQVLDRHVDRIEGRERIGKGVLHVVEVKGYAKPDYMMRRKLFLYIYGEQCLFHEVRRKGKNWYTSTY